MVREGNICTQKNHKITVTVTISTLKGAVCKTVAKTVTAAKFKILQSVVLVASDIYNPEC